MTEEDSGDDLEDIEDGDDDDDDDEEEEEDAFDEEEGDFGHDEEEVASKSSMKHAIPGQDSKVVDVAGDDLGVPQILDPVHFDTILDKIQEARNYFEDFVKLDTTYAPVQKICKNKHEQCGLWAALGGE